MSLSILQHSAQIVSWLTIQNDGWSKIKRIARIRIQRCKDWVAIISDYHIDPAVSRSVSAERGNSSQIFLPPSLFDQWQFEWQFEYPRWLFMTIIRDNYLDYSSHWNENIRHFRFANACHCLPPREGKETKSDERNHGEPCPRITRHSYSSKHQRATEGCRQRAQKRGPPRHGPGGPLEPPAPCSRTSSVASPPLLLLLLLPPRRKEGYAALSPRTPHSCDDLCPNVTHSASCIPRDGLLHLISAHAFRALKITRPGKLPASSNAWRTYSTRCHQFVGIRARFI